MFPSSSAKGGGSQIGDQMSFMDVGTFYKAQNGDLWLRSGVWVSPSSAPKAVKVPYLQATGQATGALAASLDSSVFDIATDGAGRWVIAYGNSTNVQVSTDNGATWALVAHNAGGVVTSVCYSAALDLFISGGNTSTTFYTSSVAAASVGGAWTVRTGSAITGGASNTTRVRASSAEVIMMCGNGTVGNASRSTNGTSWTAANVANGLSSTNVNNGLVSLGSGVWIALNNTAAGNRSTDGGTTWSSVTFPATIINACFGAGALLAQAINGDLYTSVTGATGSFTSLGKALGGYGSTSNYGLSLQHNGALFIASVGANSSTGNLGFYATSADGVSWTVKSALGKSWVDGGATAPDTILAAANGDYVMAPSRIIHSLSLVRGNLSAVTGVGMNVIRQSSSGYPVPIQYVRVA